MRVNHLVKRFPLSLTTLLLVACAPRTVSSPTPLSLGDLMVVIRAGDPSLPESQYNSHLFAQFGDAAQQLTAMGTAAEPAAPLLAEALAYSRRDSYMAARPLVALGPHAVSAVPQLLKNLTNPSAHVRRHSAYVLGSIGTQASCAVPNIAILLWDSDPFVRSAAAASLEAVTGVDLVPTHYQIRANPDDAGSVPGDEPDGAIVHTARDWWSAAGAVDDWQASSTACQP
jgi:hypothetical protein